MQATSEANLQRPEPELLRLLGHRYGDGLVYLQDRAEQPVYETAVRRGLIDHGRLPDPCRARLDRTAFDGLANSVNPITVVPVRV